jgi:hypothetical protein
MADQTDEQPDLWSGRDPGSPHPRPLLPNDLAGSLRYLSDGELTRLAEAVVAERERRGMPATATRRTPKEPAKRKATGSPRRTVEDASIPLTASQISLIRSSIKAGVKPSVLSRQFGISRAQIRAALDRG